MIISVNNFREKKTIRTELIFTYDLYESFLGSIKIGHDFFNVKDASRIK